MTFGLEQFIANKTLVQFIVFNVLAVVRTLLDILVWRFLVWCFKPSFGITKFFEKLKLNRYALAQAISFVIASFVSYYANKIITFNDNSSDKLSGVVAFVVISLISLVVSVGMMELMTSNKKILATIADYMLINKHWPLIAKIATIIVTLFINYFGQKYFVFGG